MLVHVLEGWLDRLIERDFDEPFRAILRSRGFMDIHYTHGPCEFGKDFIAKVQVSSEVHQYGIQCKAGDINGRVFNAIRGQLDELMDRRLAHPSYDATLPRRHVLLTTGRLKGKAIVSATALAERVRSRDEGEFVVWDRDDLIEFISQSDPMRFGPSLSPNIVPLLGKLVGTTPNHRDLERWSRELLPPKGCDQRSLSIALVQNAVCAQFLVNKGSPLHAMSIALNGIRIASVGAWCESLSPKERTVIAESACAEYLATGEAGMADALAHLDDSRALLAWSECGPGTILAYPVCCSRLLEYLGIACLTSRASGLESQSRKYGDQLRTLVEHQPGTRHPISNRFAAHAAIGILGLLSTGHIDPAKNLVIAMTHWLCDHYEAGGEGLPGAYSLPEEETARLLGGRFECVPAAPRTHSLLAIALCDLAYVFFPDLYADVHNDIRAVEAVPRGLCAPDDPIGMTVTGRGAQDLLNPLYPEIAGDVLLPHHETPPRHARILEAPLGPALPLAIACMAQDRLFSDVYPRLPFARCLKSQSAVHGRGVD